MILNTKYTRKKKLKPVRQMLMASPKKSSRTAYMFVMNAIIIISMPIMVNNVGTQNNILMVSSPISLFLSISKP
jgi:hypothetical protein